MPGAKVGSIYYELGLEQGQFQRDIADVQKRMAAMRQDASKPVRFKMGPLEGVEKLGSAASKVIQIVGSLPGKVGKGLWTLGGLVNTLGTTIRRFGDGIVHFGQVASVFAYRMTMLTAPLTLAAVAIGKLGMDFEENLAFIGTQLDLSSEDLGAFIENVRRDMLELSTEIPLAVDDMSTALYFLVSALTLPPETAAAMVEPLSKAAVAGRASAEDMAQAGAIILNVYDHILESADGTVRLVRSGTEDAVQLAEASAEKVARATEHMYDVILSAVKVGRAEVSDFVGQLGDFAQYAEQAGASLEEAIALYAQATRVTTAGQAATWVSNFYRQLIRPDFGKTLESWGIQISEIEEGTGRWATAQRELNDAEKKQIVTIERKLRGAEGITGLYLKELKLVEAIGYVQWEITQKDSATRQKRLRDKLRDLDITRQQITFYEEQKAAIEAVTEEQVTYWTGTEKLRPTIDIFSDIAEKIKGCKSEQEKLNKIHEAFPNIRATQAFIIWLESMEETIEWTREWKSVIGVTEKAFEQMTDTVRARGKRLINTIVAIGLEFYNVYKDDIKVFIDGLRDLAGRLGEIEPPIMRQVAKWSALLIAMGPVALLIGTMLMGIGSLIAALGTLISASVIGTAIALFGIFGDKLTEAWLALSGYDFTSIKDVATFIADLVTQLGLVEEKDLRGTLEKLGLELGKLGDEKVLKFIEAFRGMWDRVVEIKDKVLGFLEKAQEYIAGLLGIGKGVVKATPLDIFSAFLDKVILVKDDFLEWAEAFRLLLEDIENREGPLGRVVAFIERLWAIAERLLGLGGKGYEALGPEEKKKIIEGVIGVALVGKLAGLIGDVLTKIGIMNVTAGVVNVKGGIGGGIGAGLGLGAGGALAGGLGRTAARVGLAALLSGGLVKGIAGLVATVFSIAIPIAKAWMVAEIISRVGTDKGLIDLFNVAPEAAQAIAETKELTKDLSLAEAQALIIELAAERERLQGWFATMWDFNLAGEEGGGRKGLVSQWEEIPEKYKTFGVIPSGMLLTERQAELNVMLSVLGNFVDAERAWQDKLTTWVGDQEDVAAGRWQEPPPLPKDRTFYTGGPGLWETGRRPAEDRGFYTGGAGLWETGEGIEAQQIHDKAIENLGYLGEAAGDLDRVFLTLHEDVDLLGKTTLPEHRSALMHLVKSEGDLDGALRRRFTLEERWATWFEGFLGRVTVEEEEEERRRRGGRGLQEMQRGGIVVRDMMARLHAGEIVYNPRRPREDLARIVAASLQGMPGPAMAGGGMSVTLNPTLHIGSFSGSRSDMMDLRRAFRDMSLDAVLEIERTLQRARRVEGARR